MQNDSKSPDVVIITAYKTRQGCEQSSASEKIGSYEFISSPSEFSVSEKNSYSRPTPINASGARAEYLMGLGKEIVFKQTIDGTGLVSTCDVADEVEKIKKLFQYNGDIHQPPVLQIAWGDDIYHARLEKFDVRCTTFSRSGEVKSADLECHFIEDMSDSTRLKQDKKSSPDLTHQRSCEQGDTWVQYSRDYYQTTAYAGLLAKYNDADNLLFMSSGQTIYIPPLEQLIRNG